MYLSVNRSGENSINRLHRNFLSLPYTRNQHSSFYYNVGLKLELIGPAGSGLNAESEDSLELKLHSFDRESIPKTWYECSSDVTKAVEQIMLVEKDNYHAKNVIAKKYEKKYSDIYPAIRWFAAEEKGQSLISDEQLDIINDWIESR